MFYYYEKDGNVLASDQGDLPWPKAEPAPGAPVFYLWRGTRRWAGAPSRSLTRAS